MGLTQKNDKEQFLNDCLQVLPEHTAPAAFLRARDAYFSFYPMFAVLKGPHIDYAKHQHLIENYRSAIGEMYSNDSFRIYYESYYESRESLKVTEEAVTFLKSYLTLFLSSGCFYHPPKGSFIEKPGNKSEHENPVVRI